MRLEFSEEEAKTYKAIVVSFDLAGFSTFCNQAEPSVAIIVPHLIKKVFDCLNSRFSDRDESLIPAFLTMDDGKLPAPNFIKYTGDGALLIWLQPPESQIEQSFCNLVVQTMRDFQNQLRTELPDWEKKWRVQKLPKRIRIGIATGIVFALYPPRQTLFQEEPCDFVGYCINLAVRLQNHCPALGFLTHGHLHPENKGMEKYVATKLKGSQNEPVAVFAEDVSRVLREDFQRSFGPDESDW